MKKWRTTDRFWIVITIVLIVAIATMFKEVRAEDLFTSNYWLK